MRPQPWWKEIPEVGCGSIESDSGNAAEGRLVARRIGNDSNIDFSNVNAAVCEFGCHSKRRLDGPDPKSPRKIVSAAARKNQNGNAATDQLWESVMNGAVAAGNDCDIGDRITLSYLQSCCVKESEALFANAWMSNDLRQHQRCRLLQQKRGSGKCAVIRRSSELAAFAFPI